MGLKTRLITNGRAADRVGNAALEVALRLEVRGWKVPGDSLGPNQVSAVVTITHSWVAKLGFFGSNKEFANGRSIKNAKINISECTRDGHQNK